jgi:hypothetical protein
MHMIIRRSSLTFVMNFLHFVGGGDEWAYSFPTKSGRPLEMNVVNWLVDKVW